MKSGKKLMSLLLVAVMVFALCGGALALDKDIVVLYTNDVHCAVDDNLGYAALAAYKAEMAKTSYVSLVDAGDALQGDVLGALSKGSYLVDIMNKVGYDVITMGNHEFDYGMARFLELAKMQSTPYVCCNFMDLKTNKPVFDAYKMIDYGGVKVAYVGIDTPETFSKSTPAYFQDAAGNYIYGFCEGNNGADLYKAVQTAVDSAKAAGAAYVIAVGHCGTDEQSAPWRSTDVIANTTGLTAFIDGHSHSTIAGDSVKDKDGKSVILTSTGTKLAAIGKLTIKTDGSVSTALITEYKEKDAGVDAFVKGIKDKNEELLSTVVAKTSVDLTIKGADGKRAVRNAETNMGDLCADAYRAIGDADIGWINGGGVRDSIPAGNITYSQIIKVNPYGNELCVVEATGQQIVDALEMASRSCPGENGGFLQVSGLKYTINTGIASTVKTSDKGAFVAVEGARRVSGVMVENDKGEYVAIDLAKTYTLASHNYMLKDAGDGLNMFQKCKVLKDCIMSDYQVLITYITENLKGVVPAAYAKAQGRITIGCDACFTFTDVVHGAWYEASVLSAYKSGVVSGMTPTTFEPNTSMSRAMVVSLLYRLSGSPPVTEKVSDYFTDCADDAWYAKAVVWAAKNKIVSGLGEGVFAPMTSVTREQLAVIVYNYALWNGAKAVESANLTAYTDAQSISEWARTGVAYCTAEGILFGSDGAFSPAGLASRAMGAAVISRI